MQSSSSPPSSPLSSVASRSPSPPADYPSPPLSNLSDTGIQSQTSDTPESLPDQDGPLAKKRKIMKPKELKTEYLDLRALNDSSVELHHKINDPKLLKLTEALRLKRKIVVIAGAGISVSAGIPDFRSSKGLFATLRSQHKLKSSGKHLFDASVYRNDSSTSSFHDMVRELSHLTQAAAPTPFHHMLATLAQEGRLMRLYTQNVDGIDTSLEPLTTKVPLNVKGPWPKTVQLHGGLEKTVCTKCGHLSDFHGALFEGPEPPSCKECEMTDGIRMAGGLRSHGIGRLRPRMVLYNEFNPDEEAIGAVSHADLRSRPDAVIVVGTSLKVPGIRRLARELCAVTRGRRGGFTAWINRDPEPVGIEFKDCWDLVVRGESDDVARQVGLPRWDDTDLGDYRLLTGEDEKEMDTKGGVFEVVLESKPLAMVKLEGIITPEASPRQQSPVPVDDMPQLKQQMLPFALPKIPVEEHKMKKKPGRKQATKPMKKITDSFNTSKTSKLSARKPSKLKESDTHSSPLKDNVNFPGLVNDPKEAPEEATVPLDTRNNTDVKLDAFDKPSNTGYGPQPEILSSPSSVGHRYYDRTETISPKGGIPAGMKLLLS